MGCIVDPGQVLEVKMSVYLRRADAGMSKHLLHRPQIAARLQQVRGERVPQNMRMNVGVYSLPHGLIF